MSEQFISEGLKPVTELVAPSSFAIGAPLLPAEFIWRETSLRVSEVLEEWKETSPCRHGSGEMYVRKHWFRLRLQTGEEVKIYFERQQRFAGAGKKARWWLFSMKTAESGG